MSRFRWDVLARLLSRGLQLLQRNGFAYGVVAGCFFLAWWQQFAATLGTSLPVLTAALLAAAAGVELGWKPEAAGRRRSRTVWLAVSAGVTLAFPGLLRLVEAIFSHVPLAWWAQDGIALALVLPTALVLLTGPVACLLRLPLSVSSGEDVWPTLRRYGFGFATGVGLCAGLLGPWGLLAWSTAAVALGILVWCGWQRIAARRAEALPPADSLPVHREPDGAIASQLLTAVTLAMLGGGLVLVIRLLAQFAPMSGQIVWTAWAAGVASALAGLAFAMRQSPDTAAHRSLRAALRAAVWVVALPALFTVLMNLSLALNATTGSSVMILVTRSLLAVAVVAPFGWLWGTLAATQTVGRLSGPSELGRAGDSTHVDTLRAAPTLHPGAVATGALVVAWIGLTNLPAPMLAVILGGGLIVCAGLRWWITRPTLGRRSWATVAGLLAVATLLAVSPQYRPGRSARLLFDSTVFTTYMAGLDAELLPFIDESRLVTTAEGPNGTLTLWKRRGSQFEFRLDGIPAGVVSTAPRLCPQATAEVLPTVLSLVLHDRPDRVLLLGLGSGVPLTTTLDFPVLHITCVDADAQRLALLREHVWPTMGADPLSDPRLQFLPADAPLAVTSGGARFDVILSQPAHPARARAAAEFTAGFYRRAAAKLAPGGVFCQRFPHIDFGPDAVRSAAQTLGSAFREVVLLEIGPGELALLASNTPGTLAEGKLIERLQRRHVRNALAQVGCDWSVPLNLAACDTEGVNAFVSENSWAGGANTASNGRFVFSLAPEMARSGPKLHETKTAIAAHAERFAAWGGIAPDDKVLLRRFSEVAGQHTLMAGEPDEYWTYRKLAKQQILENPRSLIRQVHGELPEHDIHPEDQRRMAYFRALDQALRTLDPDDVARVADFAEPYDPVISHFLHKEVAELYARCEPPDPGAELFHRLHAEYFTSPQDRSVRNIAAALRLLVEHGEQLGDPLARWDQLNAAVQMMKLRWAARVAFQPKSSSIVLKDVDESLVATEAALAEMNELAAEAGIDPEDWRLRRRFLSKTVVGPLREYRRQILPIHQRAKQSRDG